MTQTLEPTFCSTPAHRRALPAAPVLIRVPALAGSTVGGVRSPIRRRRRLRREIRVAGAWLLALIPPSVACTTWGGTRPAPLLAVNSPERPVPSVFAPAEPRQRQITLSLEPVVATSSPDEVEGPVILSGQLLPADAFEEPAHGGY